MEAQLARISRRILVANDLKSSVMLAAAVLRAAGHRVAEATNPATVLALLDREMFDSIVLNLHMPPMRGADYVREVKRRSRGARIVVMTIDAGRDKAAVLAAGADAIIEPPLTIRDLPAAVAVD